MGKAQSCCKFEIIDKSEWIIIPGICLAVGGFVFAVVSGPVGLAVVTGVVVVAGLVAEWRVRALGVAKKLMDSVNDLKDENDKLRLMNEIFETQIETFGSENDKLKLINIKFGSEIEKFENVVGLLGDNVEDLESAKTQLFELYNKYKIENDKQESNNLLTLFGLVDKNQDSRLSKTELQRMREYIKIVYNEDFDFDILDSDDDGVVSLKEFFEKFRNRNNHTINMV
jgi:hypothetical protein